MPRVQRVARARPASYSFSYALCVAASINNPSMRGDTSSSEPMRYGLLERLTVATLLS